MRKLADTMAQLAAKRLSATAGGDSTGGGRLAPLQDFGSNPGALKAYVHIPEKLRDGAALVVVLHGCTQTAGAYDIGSGWSEMADRHGFAVLFPEQQRQNNPNLCFNWFSPEDIRRGSGEALSIREMVGAIAGSHPIDPARIFVTGLSAGGAMTSALLATYPDVFAGGAIIAGLPFGCASGIHDAFDRMRGHGLPGGNELAEEVRKAFGHAGPWPTVSIWHGTADSTVSPANADAIVNQWRPLHQVPAEPSHRDTVDGYPHRVWRHEKGRAVIEAYSITGMNHGTPLDPRSVGSSEKAGPFMLDVGISSTGHLCRFWGLSQSEGDRSSEAAGTDRDLVLQTSPAATEKTSFTRAHLEPISAPAPSHSIDVGKVIEDALRAAGLMR